MDILEKIFGSSSKVKIMRIFLFNPGSAYDTESISIRAKVPMDVARKDIKLLQDISLIKHKVYTKTIKSKNRSTPSRRRKVRGWTLNEEFYYLVPLQNFLIKTSLLQDREIIKKISRVGRIKLLIISGVFIQEWESRVDLLIVGDGLRKGAIDSTIKTIEAEVGKELSYAAFETTDFNYRLGMYDKLIRDILDYPHRKIINKIGLN